MCPLAVSAVSAPGALHLGRRCGDYFNDEIELGAWGREAGGMDGEDGEDAEDFIVLVQEDARDVCIVF